MRNLAIKAASWAQARKSREDGQTVIEYALVVAGVSIVLIVLLGTFGSDIIDAMQDKVDAYLS